MPGYEITASAIAEVIEAHLRVDHPPAAFEASCGDGGDRCMPRVDKPIQVGAPPPELDGEVRVQRLRQLFQRSDRNAIEPMAFGTLNEISSHARTQSEIDLAPAAAAA